MSANHSLQKLLDELGRLPGIGPKSAQRIAYYLLEADAEEARRLAEAILEVKQEVHFCSRCFNYATADECSICQDSMRDTTRICVVGEPRDVQAIERTGSYHGLYHVLGGVISPMDKIGPEQLHIRELLARLGHEDIHEVIIATNPNIEGETTASYLARTIKPLGVAPGERPACGRRPGVCRRAYAWARHRGPPRDLAVGRAASWPIGLPHGVLIIGPLFMRLLCNKPALYPLIAWTGPLASRICPFVAQPFGFADTLNYGYE